MPFHKPESSLSGLTQKKMSISGEMNPILGVQVQEMPLFHMCSNSLAVLSSLGIIYFNARALECPEPAPAEPLDHLKSSIKQKYQQCYIKQFLLCGLTVTTLQ